MTRKAAAVSARRVAPAGVTCADDIPELARLFLDQAVGQHGHDPGAVQRLRGDAGMAPVWAWLSRLRDMHAQAFVVAALQAKGMHAARRSWRRNGRTLRPKDYADFPALSIRALCAASRQSAPRVDYLRAFIGGLHDWRFPVGTRGTQQAIATTANVVLDVDSITPQQVNKVLRSLRKILPAS
jgi:hypothetical protein